MSATEKRQRQRGTDGNGDEPEVDQELRQQIVEAVEPLISDLSQQISQTVRQSFQIDAERQAESPDDTLISDRPRKPSDRNPRATATADAPDTPEQSEASSARRATDERVNDANDNDTENEEGTAMMATDDRRQSDRPNRDAGRKRDERERERGRRRDRSESAPARTARQRQPPGRPGMGGSFRPEGAIPVMLLRLGQTSSESGAIHTAIHAYMQVIERFPQSGASRAATERLLELADDMQQAGRFYTALGIMNRLEDLWINIYDDAGY